MYPEIDLGYLILSSYFLLYALAFFISSSVFWIELKRRKENFKIFLFIDLVFLLSGLAGARIYYILLYGSLKDLLKNPVKSMSSSGTIYHGGFFLSLFIAFLIIKLTKRSFWIMADSAAPALAISVSVGRIGCFLNGCCLGRPDHLPWGIRFHPTQIYESLAMLFIFLFLWRIRRKNYLSGFIFSTYLLLWGGERFLIEFLRITTPSPFCSLSMAQIVSLVIVILALFNLLRLAKKKARFNSI